uniref:Cyclic nucleotide-binding domain-containing protein n=1 Tax=Haptolina brevifila TaxID=156173 RepID=A0A7S2BWT4_9EUKA|mmetsp:Transcript_1744/g.3512  ORF Transcript_1744/g.3512 Transcript_1744/m.3512 type:complete len:690 (+) Transcript_1744:59-2128(+)|eukprot:CAMPEP_0174737860 /NCGR_PEP_ID=MMETSP1094-20130205/68960_1 /TAXON_ID=156173 /ORGANISM="Chrysochromulina brevifilum, Strain UTEX LB 985" /LENGTH=689 /DNA_ID=CAMNT_0015941151 /DNA_START=51 /DNA_END=2120 /DNA_ORIENTATION=+
MSRQHCDGPGPFASMAISMALAERAHNIEVDALASLCSPRKAPPRVAATARPVAAAAHAASKERAFGKTTRPRLVPRKMPPPTEGKLSPRFGVRHPSMLTARTLLRLLPPDDTRPLPPTFYCPLSDGASLPALADLAATRMGTEPPHHVPAGGCSAVGSDGRSNGRRASARHGEPTTGTSACRHEGNNAGCRPASAQHRKAPVLIEPALSARPLSARPAVSMELGDRPPRHLQRQAQTEAWIDEVETGTAAEMEMEAKVESQVQAEAGGAAEMAKRAADVVAPPGEGESPADVKAGEIAKLLMARTPLLNSEPRSAIEAMVAAGQVRTVRRYAVVSIGVGSLAVVIEGCLLRLDEEHPNGALANEGEQLNAGALLHEEGLLAISGAGRTRGEPFKALVHSKLLVLSATQVGTLRAAGHLTKASAAAQLSVCSSCLRKLAFFRALSAETIERLAGLFHLRVCAPGDLPVPPDSPEALIFVAKGSVHVPASERYVTPRLVTVKAEPATTVSGASARCWCNENSLVGRPPRTAPPTALTEAMVLVVLPEDFPDLRVALPTFAATAGSSTLMAMREELRSHATSQKREHRDESLVTAAQRTAEEVSAAAIRRWERLTYLLLPQKGPVASNFSLHVADYQPRRKVPTSAGKSAHEPPYIARRRAANDARRAALADAQAWRSVRRVQVAARADRS